MKNQPNAKTLHHFSWRLSACAIGALVVIAACGGGGGNAGDINTNPTAVPSKTATSTPLPTATHTPLSTPTWWLTPTPTPTPSKTATPTSTQTPSNTPTPSKTATPTYTAVPTAASTLTPTKTKTPTTTPSNTPTPIATNTAMPTATRTATNTPSATSTVTPVPTPQVLTNALITPISDPSAFENYKWFSADESHIFLGSSALDGRPSTKKINKLTNEIVEINKYCKKQYLGTEISRFDCLSDPNVAVATGQGIVYLAQNGNSCCGAVIYKVDTNEVVPFYEPLKGVSEKTAFMTNFAGHVDTVNPPSSEDSWGVHASMKRISLIITDNNGNLFFMDDGLLRKLIISTKDVTTIAGVSGQYGTVDGIGSAARFSFEPPAMFADGQNSIFILEGHAIRKLDLRTKEVTTFLGVIDQAGDVDGIGSAVRFNKPYAITGDRKGHLYIADENSETIKKIDIATKAVSVIIGTVGVKTTPSDSRIFQPGPAPGLILPVGMLHYNDNALYYTTRTLNSINNSYLTHHVAKSSPLP